MLLTILLLQTNIKQILDRPFIEENHKALVVKIGNFIEGIITQWYWQPVVTIPCQIYYLQHFQPQNPHQKLDNKDNYVFAFGQQGKSQLFQDMTATEKQELLVKLKSDYRQIIINYFLTDKALQERIDKFINNLFYTSIPIPQIIEIHMEIMDEFAKQLMIEGKSNETLIDYRLTLIDILAHLCELYRCSVVKLS